jgi:hypothetical protein
LKQLIIDGMKGFGDNIYSRAFVKTLSKKYDVYIATPYPELYEDLPLKFLSIQTPLRTQSKNIARQTRDYDKRPSCASINPSYTGLHLSKWSILQSLKNNFKCEPSEFDLPDWNKKFDFGTKKPICVVRPATIRKEWLASARNPNPKYIYEAIEALRKRYFIVSVADISPPDEIALEPMPYADLRYDKGELGVIDLLSLIKQADLVVGGVGWIVPACLATKTKLFCILGGNGAYNSPSKILDDMVDSKNVKFAIPRNYCNCKSMTHECDKTIDDFTELLNEYLD